MFADEVFALVRLQAGRHVYATWGRTPTETSGPLLFATAEQAEMFRRSVRTERYTVTKVSLNDVRRQAREGGWKDLWTWETSPAGKWTFTAVDLH